MVAWRAGTRDRLALHAGAGVRGAHALLRVEGIWQFHLAPRARTPGAYLAAGVAGDFADEARGLLVAAMGIDLRPAARSAWTAELGVGGGLRFTIGRRWGRAAR